MILTYISDRSNLLKKGDDYFCFEIYIDFRMNNILYGVVNSYNEIAIYDGADFSVKEGYLDSMVFIPSKSPFNDDIIRLQKINELDELCDDVNGIWGAYHDGNKEVEEKVHAVLIDQAEKEGFPLEKIVAV